MNNGLLHSFQQALLLDLPGKQAQEKMMPEGRILLPSANCAIDAAVMILMYAIDAEWFTILIQRTEYDGAHSGQISFPGGKADITDAGLLQTALRETKEEIGIDPDEISYAGKLTPLFIPVSNMQVHPFVGILSTKPSYIPDSKEVEAVIDVSIGELLNPDNVLKKQWQVRGTELLVPYYLIHGHEIWGATAMIMAEFLEVWSRAGLVA